MRDKDRATQAENYADDSPLEQAFALLNKLPEADRVELLKHLVSKPMSSVTLSEVLKALAQRLATGTLGLVFLFSVGGNGLTVNEVDLEPSSEDSELERKLVVN
jgi:hypothetical protein